MIRQTSKIFVVTILALAVLASAVAAANKGVRRPARGITVRQFARVLNLTQDQTAEVKSILTSLRQDAKAVIKSNRTKQEKRTEVVGLRQRARNNINSVLTIAQKEKADGRNLVNRLLMPRKAGMPLRQAMARLNLTPDQKTQVRAIAKDAAARGKAIRQDKTLNRQEKMAKLQDNRRAAMRDVSSILTPDQRAKLQQWLRNHKRGMATAA